MQIVFATHNPHKIREVKAMFQQEVELLSLDDINCTEDIPETQDTLEGNALQKARYIYEKYGKNCFADDTGLEVEALNGKPGVLSARYAGEQKNSDDNMNKLLTELKNQSNRKARFRTVIALIINGEELLFDGIAEGEIIDKKKGLGGFGYDPIFVPTGYDQSFSEMPEQEKNTLSHRYKATKMLVEYLMSLNFL